MSTTLKEKYRKEIAPKLQKDLSLSSSMAVPYIKAVKLNIGMGRWLGESKDYSELENNLALIAGQKPVVAKAKKAISNFKVREGMPVGLSVTLRSERAYQFLDKFVNVIAPRIRDFRGFSPKGFDGNGNYSVGIKDYQIFPEINPENVSKTSGMQMTIVTTAKDDEQCRAMLDAFNFPFKKPKSNQNN